MSEEKTEFENLVGNFEAFVQSEVMKFIFEPRTDSFYNLFGFDFFLVSEVERIVWKGLGYDRFYFSEINKALIDIETLKISEKRKNVIKKAILEPSDLKYVLFKLNKQKGIPNSWKQRIVDELKETYPIFYNNLEKNSLLVFNC